MDRKIGRQRVWERDSPKNVRCYKRNDDFFLIKSGIKRKRRKVLLFEPLI